MRFAASARNVARLAGFIIGALSVGVLGSTSAQAVNDTRVDAVICQVSSSAVVAITSPLSQTAVGSSAVTIEGSVSLISQMTVYVDDQYIGVFALASGAQTFSYDVTLTPGSHTVKFVGQDICQVASPVAQVTLIYDPSVPIPPVTGPSDATGSPSRSPVAGGPAVIAADLLPEGSLPESLLTKPLDALGDMLYSGLVVLDFVRPGSAESLPCMILRFILLFVGLFLLFFARLVVCWIVRVAHKPAGEGLRAISTARLRMWVRIIGLGIIIAVFVLLS